MKRNKVTFSFGKNWKNYLPKITEEEINKAKKDIEYWLGKDSIIGKSVIDIGSGSGIHSLAFYQLGAKQVYSFDVDQFSVEATKTMWENTGQPENWIVSKGSILDNNFLQSLGKFDIVYCWGVLFATGDMWGALKKVLTLVIPGGIVWFTMYPKGPRYQKDLSLKKKYNSASDMGKRLMIYKYIGKVMFYRLRTLRNPFAWNTKKERGMNAYHDIIDWHGGLPYEVASEDEVLQFCKSKNYKLEKIKVVGEGGMNNFVFTLNLN